MGLIVPTAMHPERDDQPMSYDWFVGVSGMRNRVETVDLKIPDYTRFCGSCSTPFMEPETSKFSSQLSA
jgi:hypothetical protein